MDRLFEITAATTTTTTASRNQHHQNNHQNQPNDDNDQQEMEQLIQLVQRFASDAYRLTLSLSGRVQPEQWERVVEKLHQRVAWLVHQRPHSVPPPPLHVWVMTNPLHHNTTTETTLPVTWAHQLQGVLQRLLLGTNHSNHNNHEHATALSPIVVRVFDLPFVTTDIYTHAVKYQAFDLAGNSGNGKDNSDAS